jgi:hypothetical protein
MRDAHYARLPTLAVAARLILAGLAGAAIAPGANAKPMAIAESEASGRLANNMLLGRVRCAPSNHRAYGEQKIRQKVWERDGITILVRDADIKNIEAE